LDRRSAAQDYPSGPLRIVVPFQAGGSRIWWRRTLAQKLKDRFNNRWWWRTAPARTAR